MGKVRMFAIQFAGPANEMPVFYSRQQIQGTVLFDLTEPMKMRGIHVKLKGKARVHWTEQVRSGESTVTKHYTAHEHYVDASNLLFGKPQGDTCGENPILEPGYYQYPFSFLLPTGVPSSFESRYGRIRYSVKAVIDKPWKLDHETTRPFTMIGQLDLNMMPETKMGVDDHDEKTICCLCCASGPIEARFQLERTGFVPGEIIFIKGSVNNNSSREICSTKFKLVQKVGCHARGRTKRQTHTIVEQKLEGLGENASKEYPQVQLQVPSMPSSELQGCSIIDLKYIVQMVADPSGTPMDLDVSIPVTIGTIPLADSYWYYMQQMGTPTAIPSAPPELPPPSYSELYDKTMISTEPDDDDDAKKSNIYGDSNWTPMYTYYTYGPPSAPPM